MRLYFLIAAMVVALGSSAHGSVVVDRSVDVIGLQPGFNAVNQAASQNFLVEFTLGAPTVLTGGDIYSDFGVVLGTPVVVKFTTSVGGAPDTSSLISLTSVLSAIDTDGSSSNPSIKRLHADFAPTPFAAGTYFYGLSGSGTEIGWNIGFNTPGSDAAFQLSGNDVQFSFNNDAAFAFRLEDGGTVPEPATWAMLVVGFGLTGAAARRRVVAAG